MVLFLFTPAGSFIQGSSGGLPGYQGLNVAPLPLHSNIKCHYFPPIRRGGVSSHHLAHRLPPPNRSKKKTAQVEVRTTHHTGNKPKLVVAERHQDCSISCIARSSTFDCRCFCSLALSEQSSRHCNPRHRPPVPELCPPHP